MSSGSFSTLTRRSFFLSRLFTALQTGVATIFTPLTSPSTTPVDPSGKAKKTTSRLVTTVNVTQMMVELEAKDRQKPKVLSKGEDMKLTTK